MSVATSSGRLSDGHRGNRIVEESKHLERFVAQHTTTWDDDTEEQWQAVTATLCFVDISGFTNLSERLAALGRVGAEELTEVLNRVFGSMLELSRLRDGALLKYGGDALLLIFESEDHAVQAASAAVEMRAALRTAVEIPTSVGHVPLKMSIGVHSGEVHLFRAGGTHNELIVAGPAATTVAEMEATADAGEIVISAATRDLLPKGSATEEKDEGWLLRWRKARREQCGARVTIEPDETVVEAAIPTELRSFLSSTRADSEHRLAAVVFVEFLGLDVELSESGPEAVASTLGDLIGSVTAIADQEGVTFLATDVFPNGGKIILVSGVPSTQIDECGRILRVARRISDLDTSYALKIGVNRGHVFAGEIGTDHRSTFTVMGDTVNVAARLMAAAPPGSIYSEPGVLDESRTLFESTRLEPLSVKGKDDPVQACLVGSELGYQKDHTSDLLPFTGRGDEFALMTSALERVQNGQGGSVTVTGPTGIGKTRLLEECLVAVGTDVYVIEVRAEPYGAASPFRPFRDQVREILSVDRGTNEEMSDALLNTLREYAPAFLPYAPLVGDVAHIDLPETPETAAIDPQFRQTRVADIVVELLSAWTDEPLVIVAEDVHWADPASISLLERLTREADARSWLVMETSRESLDGELASTIALEPLDPATTEELVYLATETAPLRPDEVTAIAQRSGGNPLFIQELLRVVRETGDTTSLPTSLDGVVGSQIDALDSEARRVLGYVAVLGRSFRTSIARELVATQGVEFTPRSRVALTRFLDDDGTDRLRFRHALVRDVAYEGLPYRRRRDLHNRAGHLVLERSAGNEDAVLDILSLHFSLGGDQQLAWKYSRLAGDRNMDAYANVEAATEFERAIDAARRLESVSDIERKVVWVSLGDVCERSGQFARSLDAYRRATQLTGSDVVAKAGLMLKRARARERSGAYSVALSETTRGRRLCENSIEEGSMQVVADALVLTALIRQAQQRPQLAMTAAKEAVIAAEAIGDDIALARAWMVMDYAHVVFGQLDLAVNSARSLKIFQDAGDLVQEASVSVNLGAFAYWNGDWTQALEYYQSGRDASVQVGSMVEAARAAANMGEVLVNQGRYEEAEEPLRAARRVYVASGFSEGVGFVDLLIGRMYGIRGELVESEEALKSSIEELEDLGIGGSILEARIYLADAKCREGSPVGGLEILAEAEAAAPAEYVDYFMPLRSRMRGSILTSAGRLEEGIACLKEAISATSTRGEAFEHALLVLTLERVAAAEVTEPERDAAREALRRLGVRSAPGISLTT